MLSEPGKRPLRPLKIDLDELAFAFENSNYESQNYLWNLITGWSSRPPLTRHFPFSRF